MAKKLTRKDIFDACRQTLRLNFLEKATLIKEEHDGVTIHVPRSTRIEEYDGVGPSRTDVFLVKIDVTHIGYLSSSNDH